MGSRLRSISFSVLAAIALATIAHSTTFAASPQTITMSPASTELSVDPGASVDGSFTLINGGDAQYTVTPSVAPYSIGSQDLTYNPVFTQLPGTTAVNKWVDLSTKPFAVNGHDVIKVDYTVTVPKATAPGGYYAVIFAETSQAPTAGQSGITPHNRVGNVLYITVNGDVKTSGTAKNAPLSMVQIQNSVPLGIIVTNTGGEKAHDGGVHFLATTTINVTSIGGQNVFKGSQQAFVLPNTERLMSQTWTPSLPIGIYKVTRSVSFAGKTVTLPAQEVIVATPWFTSLLIVALGLIGVAIIIRVGLRRKQNKSTPSSKKTQKTAKKGKS